MYKFLNCLCNAAAGVMFGIVLAPIIFAIFTILLLIVFIAGGLYCLAIPFIVGYEFLEECNNGQV